MAPRQALRPQAAGNGSYVHLCHYNERAQVKLSMNQLRAAQHITAPIKLFLERLGMDMANVQLGVSPMPVIEVVTRSGWQPIGQVQPAGEPRPPAQLVMSYDSVRLQGGEHRKFCTFNHTAAVGVTVTQDMIRGRERVTPELVDFLAYLGVVVQANAIMPIIEVVRSGQWVDINDAPNRRDEDSRTLTWFAWNSRMQPVSVGFSTPRYENIRSLIAKMVLWLQLHNLWCDDPADWPHSTLRLTNCLVTFSEAVAMKQQGAGLPWLAWLAWFAPILAFLPNVHLVPLPPHFTLWDWLEHGALLECAAGVLQIALQPYHVYEYLVSWYKALARGDSKNAEFFKRNFLRQLHYLLQAWMTGENTLFAKAMYRRSELEFTAPQCMFVAALLGFTPESRLMHSGEGTLTSSLGLPREGLGPRLNEATITDDLYCYLRPILGPKQTLGLLGRRVFGEDAVGDEHVHSCSMNLPLLRASPLPAQGVRSLTLANVNHLGRRPGTAAAAFAVHRGNLRQPLVDVVLKVQRALDVIATEMGLPPLSATTLSPDVIDRWTAIEAVPQSLEERIEAAMR